MSKKEQNSRPPGGQVCMSTRKKLLGGGAGDVMKGDIGYIEEEQRDLQLSVFEKKYLLCSERGDVPAVRALLEKHKSNNRFNINCRDAVGRSALTVAIENENMELIDLLLNNGIEPGDALLHAISEEYVEAVEVLLQHEEKIYKAGRPYSWEAVDHDMAIFTKDITPLILAAHRDNYEIIKLLLDRGASLPMPHNVRCGCDECVVATKDDCLRHSRSRINAYRALTSPSLICLSSTDPIQTAFTLSSDLAKLSSAEHEFKTDYRELRHKCENYATALLDHTRTSYELEVMLNYDPNGPVYVKGERMKLERLKLAILCKQKSFVAHPNVQQLLASVWYEGSPGFRRKGVVGQLLDISKMGMMCPVYSMAYMLAPDSELGQTMKKPFTKFIGHSTAYCFFLLLLIMASQRVETLIMEWIGTNYFLSKVRENQEKERGKLPGIVESAIVLFVIGFVWAEIKQLWDAGLYNYLMDMWNVVDFFTNMLYLTCIGLRLTAWYIVQRELSAGKEAHLPREDWDPYDPMLISEGIFGAANIFSFLKMVHIFSVNPHLGPLQISLGRMVFDIIKFFFIYSLVLFAFGCGMNQLLWYYADIDKELCYSGPGGSPNSNYEQSCLIWRRFANLFETSQSLFWASFGLVELENFDLTGIKSYTRFWSLLMFGSYSVINVVVLLNLLIAMMSNSYQIISERADVEWKFARSKLWMSYFEDGATVPPPFNIFPTLKSFKKLLCCKIGSSSMALKEEEEYERDVTYRSIMRCLVRRYVTSQQRKAEDAGITEDDVNEVKQAVTSFRSELFEILRTNGMKGVSTSSETLSRKERLRERRLLKDFNIDLVETVMEAFMKDDKKTKFSLIRRLTNKREKAKKNWNAIVGAARSRQNPIGSTSSVHGGSLKELRDKVFQEQELPSKRAVRRFVQAAKKIIHDEQIRKASMTDQCDNVNNISAIEEEVPGTFSTNATPRNSMQQEPFNEESLNFSKENFDKSLSTRRNSGIGNLPRELSEKSPSARKGSDVQKMPNELSDKSPSTRKGSDGIPSARKGSDGIPSARKGSDGIPSARKGSDVTPPDRKGSDVTPSSRKRSDVTPSSRKGSDVTPSSRKGSDGIPSARKESDSISSARKGSDVTPTARKGSDVTPTARKGSDVTPSVQKGSDMSSSVLKGSDVSPSVRKGSDVSPSVRKGSDVSPSVQKGSDVSPSVQKGSDVSPSVRKGSDVSPSVRKGSDVSPSVRKGSDVSPSVPKGSDVSPSVRKGSDVSPSVRKGSNVIPSARKGSDVTPSVRKGFDVAPSAQKGPDVQKLSKDISEKSLTASKDSSVKILPKDLSDKSPTARKGSEVQKLTEKYSSKYPTSLKSSGLSAKELSDKSTKTRKSSDVIVDIETESLDSRSKRLESCPAIGTSESKVKGSLSNVKGMISKYDEKAGEKKEDESEIRRLSEPVASDKSVSAKKKSAKVAPKEETVGWL